MWASNSVGRLQAAGLLLAALLMCGAADARARSSDQSAEIDKLMSTLSGRGQFNGAILVARRGEVIYRKGFGKANFKTGGGFAPETQSDIGSVTKQFTAMAIMILAEKNTLSYDDPVSKYIPEFSRSEHLDKITLRQLLTHTSGIPDYGDLGIDDSGLDQQGLIAALLKKELLLAGPGLKYRYSNPGYALLAIAVERVSGKRFGDFLEQEIFKPAGMTNTFVYDSPGKKDARAAVGYGQFGQVDDGGPTAIPGDGGIYSTVDDLFQWDRALYTDTLVGQSMLTEAFTPGRVEEGTSAYGFGWNVGQDDKGKYLWHTGSHAGFRAFIERRISERLTVIMLTNKGNSKRQDINAAIQNILGDKPYVLPKQSGAETLYKAIHDSGIRAALEMYDALKGGNEYDLGESELNTLGYQLLYGDKRISDAIAIFQLNTREHSGSSNAFDSLGEAYRVNGESALAIKSYKTAVKLDPSNGHASAMLKELEPGRALWIAALTIGAAGVLLVAAILVRRRSRRQPKRKLLQ
jgi:CubicO group peptidase (beta-lactamase class C family)